MAVCTWTLLEEDWDAVGTWADGDTNGAVSSISPAGQLYLDDRALTALGKASRSKDIGTIGAGDYTVYLRFKGDVWDGNEDASNNGIKIGVSGSAQYLIVQIANGASGGDGVFVRDSGANYVKVVTKTWDNDWHTIRFDVHNNQTDVDIYIDDEESPSATDATCDTAAADDGFVFIQGIGTAAGDGEYHIDYLKINDGNCDPADTGAISKRLLRGQGR